MSKRDREQAKLAAAAGEPKKTRLRVNSTHGTLRITAGFWFNVQAIDVEVDAAQLKEIESDPILHVVRLDEQVESKPRNDGGEPTAPVPVTEDPRPIEVRANPEGARAAMGEDARPPRDAQAEAEKTAEAERLERIRALPSQEERAKLMRGPSFVPLPTPPAA